MKKLLRILAVAVLGVSLSTGLATAHTGIDNGNGTNSTNLIDLDNDVDVNVDNSNLLSVIVDNYQDADSGDAEANENTTVGDVGTGDASNSATVNTTVHASNSSACECTWGSWSNNDDATIHNGNGTGSTNTITMDNDVNYTVLNSNDVTVNVENDQYADSGDATANANTTVGDVTTGDASNSFSSSTSVTLSN